MKYNHQWLFIEPYVHLIRLNGSVLFYNTVNKKVLEFHSSPLLYQLAGEILDPVHGYVIPLDANQLDDPVIADFIIRLRNTYMGDLLDPAWSEGKPVNIYPEPFVKHAFREADSGEPPKEDELDPRNYIHELTLFLNTGIQDSASGYSGAFKQFSYPVIEANETQHMDFNLFRRLIQDVNDYTPTLIHLSGNNILKYPELNLGIKLLASSPFQKKYHLVINHWDADSGMDILSQKKSTLALYIIFPTHPDTIAGHLQSLPDRKYLKKMEFNFVIRNTEELQMTLEIIRILDLDHVYFKPYYTGKNLDFFKENVFVSREEILKANPNQRQLFSRISINETDYGRFSVTPTGEAYANLNDPPVGDTTRHTLRQLVIRELKHGKSWSRTRGKIPPCKNCLYQFLCPPISAYELYMNRFNFCDVVPNSRQP